MEIRAVQILAAFSLCHSWLFLGTGVWIFSKACFGTAGMGGKERDEVVLCIMKEWD